MIIVVDGGATKSDWRLVNPDQTLVKQLILGGTNVSAMSLDAIREVIAKAAEEFKVYQKEISGIYFYTAGVITEEIDSELRKALSAISRDAEIDCQTDLIGAARAACGHEPGISAILGTGSNSCFFDGKEITKRVYSAGFILGDEGSGAALGKLFIADFLKGFVPKPIAEEFALKFPSDYPTIVQNVYHSSSSPSGYLGSFAPFILSHYNNPYIRQLVNDNFRSFINRSLRQYDIAKYPVGIVGGFGYANRDIFSALAAEAGIRISRFIKEPIEGLIIYHTEK